MTLVAHRARFVAALAFVVASVATLAAHDFHATLAQVERTPDGRLEVALRFFPDDLEAALGRAAGRRVVVEDTKAFAAAFEPWLNAAFALESGGKRTVFKYVGAEVTVKTAWIYVEADWAQALAKSAMTNVLLVDLFADQVNTVNFVEGATRSSKVFSVSLRHADQLMATPR